jgi:hypothetical protein
MARVNRTVLTPESCPDVPVELLRVVNDFTQQVSDLLSGGLALDNLDAFTVTVEASALPVAVKNKLRAGRAPSAVLVASAQNLTAAGQPAVSLGSVGWVVAGDQLFVQSISGMTAGNSYRITLLVLGQ